MRPNETFLDSEKLEKLTNVLVEILREQFNLGTHEAIVLLTFTLDFLKTYKMEQYLMFRHGEKKEENLN